VKAAQKFLSRLLSQGEGIVYDPFMEIWKLCLAAQMKGALYFTRVMNSGDVIQEDLAQRHQVMLKRATNNAGGTEFKTYISVNPDVVIHPM